MTRLLITGFGPFPGVPRNPTDGLARSLAADRRWRRLGVAATALVLPTAYCAIEGALLPALRDRAPHAVLMLGVAKRRRAVCLETRALNRVTRRLPDASGRLPASLAYRVGAPFVRRPQASIPVLAAAMRTAAPGCTRASRDAGRYLCNAAYFDALAERGPAASSPFTCRCRIRRTDCRRDVSRDSECRRAPSGQWPRDCLARASRRRCRDPALISPQGKPPAGCSVQRSSP